MFNYSTMTKLFHSVAYQVPFRRIVVDWFILCPLKKILTMKCFCWWTMRAMKVAVITKNYITLQKIQNINCSIHKRRGDTREEENENNFYPNLILTLRLYEWNLLIQFGHNIYIRLNFSIKKYTTTLYFSELHVCKNVA